MAAVMRPFFNEADWLSVRYEDLATDPEANLVTICGFLGISYEPEMLRYRQTPWIGILGNRMAHSGDEIIRLDERWKDELPPRRQLLFNMLGGPLNRYSAYPWGKPCRKHSNG